MTSRVAKNTLITCTIVLAAMLVQFEPGLAASSTIVINEVEVDPPGSDQTDEWVELYNGGNFDVDVSNWKIFTETTVFFGSAITISEGTIIRSGEFLVLTFIRIGFPTETLLNDPGDIVWLVDKNDVEVDRTPLHADRDDNDFTWQRFPNGLDTDSQSDWVFKTQTKGLSNGKQLTTLTLSVSPSSLKIGEVVVIEGRLNVSIAATIRIELASGQSFQPLATVTSSNDGSYRYTSTPTAAGAFRIRSSWTGNQAYLAATSMEATVEVRKLASAISLAVSPLNITRGSTTTVTVTLTPPVANALVVLNRNAPNGTRVQDFVTTSTDGKAAKQLVLDASGLWVIRADWEGDSSYQSATSDPVAVTVGSPRSQRTSFDATTLPLLLAILVFALVAIVIVVGILLRGP